MKSVALYVVAVGVGLVLLASAAPMLIALAHAVLPLLIVLGIVMLLLRLVFFHTRGW